MNSRNGGPGARERRRSYRYGGRGRAVQFGWWGEDKLFRMAQGVLLDISQDGLSLRSESELPKETHVAWALIGPKADPWVELRLLKIEGGGEGAEKSEQVARFRFARACPYEFFRELAEVRDWTERVVQISAADSWEGHQLR